MIDGSGRIVRGDQLQILAAEVLERHPGAPIIADVKASQTLYDEIGRLGGRPIMWKTGHSLIKARMAEMGARSRARCRGTSSTPTVSTATTMRSTSRSACSVFWRAARARSPTGGRMVPVVNTPEIRFDCPDEQKFAVIDQIRARLEREGATFNAIDGVRVSTDDGWWLLRASNTQAVLVARAEAHDQNRLARLMQQIRHHLEAAGIKPPEY